MIVKHLKSEIIKESMGGGVEENEEKVKEREKNTVEVVDWGRNKQM